MPSAKYCLQYVPSAKYDSFLQFRDIMLFWLVVQIFSGWFWDGCCDPVIIGITFVFAFHIRRLSVVRPSYLKIFLASFLITFLSPEFTLSLNRHVPGSLWSTVMSGELWGRFCPFAFFDSVISLPYFYLLFLLPLLHAHTSIPRLTLTLFPCMC